MGKSGKCLGNKGFFIHTPIGDNFYLSTDENSKNFELSYPQEFCPHSTAPVDK